MGTNFSSGLVLRSPGVAGNSLVLGGAGGGSNLQFILSTSTNILTLAGLWSPLLTNRFDASGAFNYTNLLDPAHPNQFYRLSVP